MKFKEAVQTCFSKGKYSSWNGRASRSEYWYFYLFTFAVQLILEFAFPIFKGSSVAVRMGLAHSESGASISMLNALIMIAVGLVLFLPGLAVMGRRYHDTNRSVWHVCWLLVPFAGPVIYLFMMLQKGTDGPNRFDYPA